MLMVKKAETKEEKQQVFNSLPSLRPVNCLCIYGYWKDDVCVGASWLESEYPHYLAMEYYDKSGAIVGAIAESFKELFKIKSRLTARVNLDNYKSLKMTKQLGFYNLYIKDNVQHMEITADSWKFKKKYNLK